MSDTEKQVLRALDTYRSAVLAKNAETLMHLYAPDVRVFDAWGVWSYEGAAAWRVAAAMNLLPLRLQPGDDLRQALELAVAPTGIGGAFVLSGIGSLVDARLRLAGQGEATCFPGPSEILTLAGSLAENGAHLHLSIATETGRVFGGHLVAGNRVRTTAEVLLVLLPGWQLRREHDAATGFPELVAQPQHSA